ncbi:hypothetical protein GCM10027418_15490 [Mariniluteicoccus endophyticus]
MATRMSSRQLIGAALAALVGLYALGTAYTWLDAMLAEQAAPYIVMSVLAIVGALMMVAAVPTNHLWRRQLTAARWMLPVLAGVGGICAAVCMWFVSMFRACEGVCQPVDTWKMLPSLIAVGALCGLGPAWAALGLRGREGAGRWWAVAVVMTIIGFCVGMFFWVETGLYPNA